MSEHTTYVPSPTSAWLVEDKKIIGHVSLCGDELLMPLNGKDVLFELHHYFGPHPISKKTSAPLERIPGGFWDAFKRWELGGKLMEGKLCVVPEWCPKCKGSGLRVQMIGKRTGIDEGACEACHGKKIKQSAADSPTATNEESEVR